MDRDFRGIWISAEIWLTKEMTVGEKLMYVEIESLSKLERGCFASNAHFAEMFSISPARVSEIISSLASKGFVTVDQKRQGVRTVQRVIRLIPRGNTSSENTKNPFGKDVEGSSEKTQGKNTKILNSTKKKNVCDEEFEAAWKAYPKRDGSNPKASALKCWNARLKDGISAQAMVEGVCRYTSYCRQKEMIGTSYVMQAARFFGTNKEFENAWAMPSAIGGAPTKEWETPTRDQILAKGPRRDGKVPHDKWDSGVHQFVFPVTEDMVGQQ